MSNQTEHVYFERWRLPVTILDFQNTSFAPSTGSGKMGNNLSASTMLPGAANYGNSAATTSQRRHSTGGHSATPGIGYFQQGSGGTISDGVDDSGNASSSGDAMKMAYRSAYDQVTKSIMTIIEVRYWHEVLVCRSRLWAYLVCSHRLLRQTPHKFQIHRISSI